MDASDTLPPNISRGDARRRIFQLAWPSIISELSTPLLGIVDTLIVGHLSDASDLAGVALATAAYNPLMMVFNFLRMGTGGIIAQAFGARSSEDLVAGAARGLALGFTLGICLCFCGGLLAHLAFSMLHSPDAATLQRAEAYYRMRILGTPAALSNYVVQAWLIGVQRTDQALLANLFLNVSNAILCILLGWVMDLGVSGVGAATAIANYLALCLGLFQIMSVLRQLPFVSKGSPLALNWASIFDFKKLSALATLNGNIFFRSLCLMVIVTDFTSLSAGLGATPLAANSLLMQLQMLISFGADGFANAGEAMIGEAIGMGSSRRVRIVFLAVLEWGVVLAVLFTCVYVCCGRMVLATLTWHAEVVRYALQYMSWQWVAPSLSVTAYVMDGLFVGAMQPREMRNATLLAFLTFWVLAHTFQGSNNWLWAAYLTHLLVRAGALLCWYPRIEVAAEASTRQQLLGDDR